MCAVFAPQSRASAQAPESAAIAGVQLSIPDCGAIAGSEIERLVVLELAPHPSSDGGDARASRTSAAVRCLGLRATVTVEDPRRANPLVLELDLTETPEPARPRLLALAVAELIATSRLERAEATKPPEPPSHPPSPPKPPEPREPESQSAAAHAGFELMLGGGVARGFKPALFSPLFAAALSRSLPPFALIADLGFERGQSQTSAAALTEQTFWLGLAPAWQARAQRFTFTLGPGVRAGYARLAASARAPALTGHSLSGFVLLPIALSSLQLRFAPAWSLRLALELGYALIPLRGLDADRRNLLELRGLRATGLLGLTWTL